MSVVICARCEFVDRRPIAGGRAARLVCGRIGRPVEVCLTVMGCPRGKFKAGSTPGRTPAVVPAPPEVVEARRGVCEGCSSRSAWTADRGVVICDAQLAVCRAGGGRVSLTVGRCPLSQWATNNGGSTGG